MMKQWFKETVNPNYRSDDFLGKSFNRPRSLAGPEQKFEASDLYTVKCYLCYSPKVEVICHHCGRFICRECQHRPLDQLLQPFNWLFVDKAFAYLNPLPAKKLRRAAHCRDCFHQEIQLSVIFKLVSLLLVLLAFLNIGLNQAWFLSGLFVGAALIIEVMRWFVQHWVTLRMNYLHGFPLFCKPTIELQEYVKAHFKITTNCYLSYKDVARGILRIKLSLKPSDRERYLNERQKSFRKHDLVTLNAGFVALEQLKNVTFKRPRWRRFHENVFLLNKSMTFAEFSSYNLSEQLPLANEPYQIQLKQALRLDPPPTKELPLKQVLQFDPLYNKEFPLLIKPRLVKGGCRLEIKLEIAEKLKLLYPKSDVNEKEKGIEAKPILDWLWLRIPDNWEVEATDGQFDKERWKITWRKRIFEASSHVSVFVEFHQKNDPVEQQVIEKTDQKESHSLPDPCLEKKLALSIVRGGYRVTIDDWTVSQLHVAQELHPNKGAIVRPANGIRIFHDDDELEWLRPVIKHQSIITGKLCIDLSQLSRQQVQVISNVLEETQLEAEEDTQLEVVGQEELPVAPTYHVINEVIEALTKKRIFIRQVIETPGYTVETETGGRQVRYWEIKGKYYPKEDNLQSVTLHLVISGQEPRNNQPNCQGLLTFELSLRSYAEMDDNSQAEYEVLKDDHMLFKELIRTAAYRGRQIDYKRRRIAGWQQEQWLERKLEQLCYIDKAAVILTSNGKLEQGHIFLAPNLEGQVEETDWRLQLKLDLRQQLPELSTFEFATPGNGYQAKNRGDRPQWLIHERPQLSPSFIFESEWIDKWKLLREVEGGY